MSDLSSLPAGPSAPGASDPAANPWPGLASYTEDQRHLFFGRTAEINEVVRLVQRETLTVLFGRSGLGKSSLLRAGVMPRLREDGYFPITLRLDFSERGIHPVEQVKAMTAAAASAAGVALEGLPEDVAPLTLWEFFHAGEFWGPRNDPIIPIIALDQFEEVFTLGRNLPQTTEFIEQLADLIENRVPQSLKERLEQKGERLAYDAVRQEYKVILSLREDFVPKLDSLRPVLPAIMRNRFALAPLEGECACTVVLGAGRTWISEDDAKEIVAAVVGGSHASSGDAPLVYQPDEEVEPAYLSVMCHELFRRMQALGRSAITRDLIVSERGGILEGLYTRSFEGIDPKVRFFVEDRLLTPSGYRGTLPLADATQEGIADADLHTLVDRRLLRFEDRLGTIHMELSHDLLTRIVLKRRESRRAEEALRLETERARKLRVEQLAQRRRSRITAGVAAALAVLLIGTLWGGYFCFIQEHRAYYRSFGKHRGFPVGIGEISASDARRLPLHYILVYKGIIWDGWRPHWKPPFRLMAMNRREVLTTKHPVATYLWRGREDTDATEMNKDRSASLGLLAVCQWEFVPDASGEIAYERGLDRDGRMVWGCAYSPTTSGSSSARIAHFVGPDGFPQLQHNSAAEYVEIHYDASGFEERVLFLDAMAQPAAGPDGAFGTAKEYDSRGNTTLLLSLDAQGKPMIDRAGNCGLRLSYDQNGQTTELTSVGTDRKVFPTTEGWAYVRDRYDAMGRLTQILSFDVDNKPVVRQSNVSGMENTYDANGDLVLESYFGPDGKPMALTGEIVSIKHEYDDRGNEIRTTYLDSSQKPTHNREGCGGSVSGYDDRGNLVSRTILGTDGKPFLLADGFAAWKSEFDGQGREIRSTYYGTAGEPALHKDGNHGWEIRFDARGNPIKYTYLGLDGKPAFSNAQVAGWDAGFDPRGREIIRKFFGPTGEPVLHLEGFHGTVTSYDEHGYISETTSLNLLGKPVEVSDGYATQKIEHDSRGQETRRTYFDAAGKPVNHKDGYHGLAYKYDDRGSRVEITTIGLDGKPVLPSSTHYATERKRYDLRGNVIEQRFFATNGKATQNGSDVYVVQNRFDVQGSLIEERYLDAAGKPMVAGSGTHYWTLGYDAWGHRTNLATFGLHDEPVPGIYNACTKTIRYDERGNETEATWFGADRKPAPNKEGYAMLRTKYDDHNNLAESAYFGPDGRPCLSSDGFHKWLKVFDARRNIVHLEYRGAQDEPVLGSAGYYATDSEYNDRGNETKKTYFGVDGKPLLQASGYAGYRQSYFPDGRLSRIEYYGVDEEPALIDEGYCTYYSDYNTEGQIRMKTWIGIPGLTAYVTYEESFVDGLARHERYLSADGKLVNSAAGYAEVYMDYDEKGKLEKMRYLDAAGKPVSGEEGYAEETIVSRATYYDATGAQIVESDIGKARPLIYISFLRSRDCVATRSGLLPGDIIWQIGDFSYPRSLDELRERYDDADVVKRQLLVAWRAALAPGARVPARVVVIREGRLVELKLPTFPAAGVGMNAKFRTITGKEYDALLSQLGKSRNDSFWNGSAAAPAQAATSP